MPPFSSTVNESAFVLSSHSSSTLQDYIHVPAHQHDCLTSSRSRSVGFDQSKNQVISNNNSHDHDQEDKEIIWFTKNELKEIRAHCSQTVARVMAGKRLDEENWCERGLENMFRAASVQSKSRRRHCFKVVLEEQEQQQLNETLDVERIAQLYNKVSARSEVSAASRGMLDAEIAAKSS